MALLSELRSVWAETNLLYLIVVRSQIAHKTLSTNNIPSCFIFLV